MFLMTGSQVCKREFDVRDFFCFLLVNLNYIRIKILIKSLSAYMQKINDRILMVTLCTAY